MNLEKAMYIPTNVLQDLFIAQERLSITVDSLSILDDDTRFEILQYAITNDCFEDQKKLDILYSDSRTKIIVKAILIDAYEEGIYLVHEFDKNKITIPGGHISDIDLDQCETDLDILLLNLARELCEEYGKESTYKTYIDCMGNINSKLPIDIISRLIFPIEQIKAPLYLYNPDLINTITFYFPIVITEPSDPILDRSIYLEKAKYMRALKGNYDLTQIYNQDGINNDIRHNEYSFILKYIFNTPDLF